MCGPICIQGRLAPICTPAFHWRAARAPPAAAFGLSSQVDLGSNRVPAGGTAALAEALKGNAALTHLDLCSSSVDGAAALALAEGLKVNSALTALDIGGGGALAGDGARALAAALKANRTLAELTADLCDDGAVALADALRVNETLAAVDLSRGKVREAGGEALLGALQANRTLTRLDLGWGFDSDLVLAQLGHLLRRNRGEDPAPEVERAVDAWVAAECGTDPYRGRGAFFGAEARVYSKLRTPEALAAEVRAEGRAGRGAFDLVLEGSGPDAGVGDGGTGLALTVRLKCSEVTGPRRPPKDSEYPRGAWRGYECWAGLPRGRSGASHARVQGREPSGGPCGLGADAEAEAPQAIEEAAEAPEDVAGPEAEASDEEGAVRRWTVSGSIEWRVAAARRRGDAKSPNPNPNQVPGGAAAAGRARRAGAGQGHAVRRRRRRRARRRAGARGLLPCGPAGRGGGRRLGHRPVRAAVGPAGGRVHRPPAQGRPLPGPRALDAGRVPGGAGGVHHRSAGPEGDRGAGARGDVKSSCGGGRRVGQEGVRDRGTQERHQTGGRSNTDTQNAGATPGGTRASTADKEEGHSEAGEATRTAGTGNQNGGDGRACT